ncbi:hypothetical protein KY317_03940, partial [Candidatus Woesearchaeota archaeon]|nr:hypothetical protein [Candidatus Woesearchaeota archaeon]
MCYHILEGNTAFETRNYEQALRNFMQADRLRITYEFRADAGLAGKIDECSLFLGTIPIVKQAQAWQYFKKGKQKMIEEHYSDAADCFEEALLRNTRKEIDEKEIGIFYIDCGRRI